jgi:GNAT superfamily N-acetyltransferase
MTASIATGPRHTLAQLGWLNAALYWLGRALAMASGGRWALHRYRFVAQYVADAPRGRAAARGADILIRPHLPDEPLPDGYPRPEPVLRARFAQGARSLSAWRNGRLAGFLWLVPHAYQEDEVRARYRLASLHSVWDFDVWVHPDERLGWVFPRLWEAARTQLREHGVRWSCSRISAFNPASLRAHARIGIVPLGEALFVRCGHWQWMFATLAPYFHLSRGPASFPQLMFDTGALADVDPDVTPPEQPCPPPKKSATY